MHKTTSKDIDSSLLQSSANIEENSTDILYCVFDGQGRVANRYHDENAAKKHAEKIGGYVHRMEW